MATTTWYAGGAGDVLVDEQNNAHAGLQVDLFTDRAFTTRAVGLVNEAGTVVDSTPAAADGGAVRFGDPTGGTRTYFSPRRYKTVAGVVTPDPAGGCFEWRPDPQTTYAPFGPVPPDHTRTPIWIDTSASVPVIRYWDGSAWVAIPGGGGVGSSFLITDNGDGTATVTPTGSATVVDNGDGTATLTGGSVTDNGDGTAVIAA